MNFVTFVLMVVSFFLTRIVLLASAKRFLSRGLPSVGQRTVLTAVPTGVGAVPLVSMKESLPGSQSLMQRILSEGDSVSDFRSDERIGPLIEGGHIKVVMNEFDEEVLQVAPSLQEVDPDLYDLFTETLTDLLSELEIAGFIATGITDDGDSYFYATNFGEEFFLELIESKRLRSLTLGLEGMLDDEQSS
jgi:hypothetical protein